MQPVPALRADRIVALVLALRLVLEATGRRAADGAAVRWTLSHRRTARKRRRSPTTTAFETPASTLFKYSSIGSGAIRSSTAMLQPAPAISYQRAMVRVIAGACGLTIWDIQ